MGLLRVGCPMWAHRPWVGRWFPAETVSGSELATYATWCNTVEGNTTHYASPAPRAVARWAALAPVDFRFCFKVPRLITHERRLRNASLDISEFLDALEPLFDRLGPVQIQLPASFGPGDIEVLAGFCRQLSREVHWAVETRHRDFAAGGTHERELNDAMAKVGINRVLLDSRTLFTVPPKTQDEIEAWERKPRLPIRPVATGNQPLVRFIGTSDPELTAAGWGQWVTKVVQWCESGLEPYVFIHTPDNLDSPSLARRFWGEVAAVCPGLEPLPIPLEADVQLGLFGA